MSSKELTMTNTYILASLIVYLLLPECTSECLISGHIAICRSVSQVPVLPPAVTRLDLSLNYFQEINEASFAGLEGLRELDLGSQRKSGLIIKNNAFKSLSNLSLLHLGDNRFLQLEPNAFMGLSNLRTLILMVCNLNESILEDNYLRPLVSLEKLNLYGNAIQRIQPAPFFTDMTQLQELDLSLNRVNSICEADLLALQGKSFRFFGLNSLYLMDMEQFGGFDWKKCGNPFRNMSMDQLDLSHNGFNVEKARLFFKAIEGTKIRHLIIKSNSMGASFGFNNLKDPNKDTFGGLKKSSINSLDLSKSFIFSLKYSVFSPLEEVTEMTLAQNYINQIERNAFFGLQNLEKLNLSSNIIGEIYSYMFENLPNIKEIDLSYNHIGALAPQSFTGLPNLEALDLSGNSIRTIHTFAPLSQLQVLNLNDNKITSLYGLSNFASNTRLLSLKNNRVRNIQEVYDILAYLPHIEYLFFGNNFISSCYRNKDISVPHLNNLTYLDLENSALEMIWSDGTCLDVFDNLGKLLDLYLSHNSLRSLPEAIFKGLASLEVMDLSFNSLTYLPQNIFPSTLQVVDLSNNFLGSPNPDTFRTLRWINLNMNRFLCDCSLEPFVRWLNQTNVTFGMPVEELRCEFPRDKLNVALLNVSMESCEEDDEKLLQTKRLSFFIGMTTFLILFILATLIFAHFRGDCFKLYKKVIGRVLEGPQKAPPSDGLKYDAYLCFSGNDFKWVEGALLKRLDSQFSENNPLRCCFEARDFLPGENHLSNIRDAIWESKKTVCIVTREFLKDGWCLEAFSLAQSRMLDELKDVLVMVVIERIPLYRLMKYEPIRTFVQKREYLQWPEDSQDIEWFYEKLALKIQKEERIQKKPTVKDNDIALQDVVPVNM